MFDVIFHRHHTPGHSHRAVYPMAIILTSGMNRVRMRSQLRASLAGPGNDVVQSADDRLQRFYIFGLAGNTIPVWRVVALSRTDKNSTASMHIVFSYSCFPEEHDL